MILLEEHTATHLIRLPRRMVQRIEIRATRKAGQAGERETRQALARLGAYMRRLLADHRRQGAIEIKGSANWFSWLCAEVGDGSIGLAIGLQLQLGP